MAQRTPSPPHVPAGTPRRHEAPRVPHGHGHRTSRGIQTSIPSPSEAASSQPTHRTSTSACPSNQARNSSQQIPSPHPHGQPPRTLHPVSPWEQRLAHGRLRAKAAKTFPTGTGRPSENSGASAFRFPLALPLSRRRHPHHKARQGGRAPTRGGRQPWERASTRGRTRQSARI